MKKLKLSELNRISVEEYKQAEKNPIIIILDDIRSQNNIGSFFRTADAFRLHSILLCGICAQPPHREIHKTALGSTESVDWKYFEEITDAITYCKELGYKVFALEQTDKSVLLNTLELDQNDKTALVFGNEVKGVQNKALEVCDRALEIPQFGTKHSLNVSVSGGIAIWSVLNKLGKV